MTKENKADLSTSEMTKTFIELSLWKNKRPNGQSVEVINLLPLFRVVILPIIPMDVIYNRKE